MYCSKDCQEKDQFHQYYCELTFSEATAAAELGTSQLRYIPTKIFYILVRLAGGIDELLDIFKNVDDNKSFFDFDLSNSRT